MFLYRNGGFIDLGTLGGNYNAAFGINNRGQIVGASSYTPSGLQHAFFYSNSHMQDLGTLGPKSVNNSSLASRINDHNQIIGWSTLQAPEAVSHAFLYTGGPLRDLGTLPGRASGVANDINNVGEIVGDCSDGGASGNFVAFLYLGERM